MNLLNSKKTAEVVKNEKEDSLRSQNIQRKQIKTTFEPRGKLPDVLYPRLKLTDDG